MGAPPLFDTARPMPPQSAGAEPESYGRRAITPRSPQPCLAAPARNPGSSSPARPSARTPASLGRFAFDFPLMAASPSTRRCLAVTSPLPHRCLAAESPPARRRFAVDARLIRRRGRPRPGCPWHDGCNSEARTRFDETTPAAPPAIRRNFRTDRAPRPGPIRDFPRTSTTNRRSPGARPAPRREIPDTRRPTEAPPCDAHDCS